MRIIAGEYGGRPLKSVPGQSTRPTTDKVKEAMFQMLGPFFDEGVALDLYAGSGALGIEAVSRGMDQSILVDKDRMAVKTIQENIKITKEEHKFKILPISSSQACKQLGGQDYKIDLLLLDPPYQSQQIQEDIKQLIEYNVIHPQTIIMCEVDKHTELPGQIEYFEKSKERNYGLSNVVIYEKGV